MSRVKSPRNGFDPINNIRLASGRIIVAVPYSNAHIIVLSKVDEEFLLIVFINETVCHDNSTL